MLSIRHNYQLQVLGFLLGLVQRLLAPNDKALKINLTYTAKLVRIEQ